MTETPPTPETEPPVLPPAIISYGGGRCAACGVKTRTGYLMCARHWDQVPNDLKSAVYDALRMWNVHQVSLHDLRTAQAAAVEYVTGKPVRPSLEGGEEVI